MKLTYYWLVVATASSLIATVKSEGCHLEGNVRLVNGNNKFEGLVEICIQGEWRNVNGYKWDIKEATVVCRQLGFSGDLNPVAEQRCEVDNGQNINFAVECTGEEANVSDCRIYNVYGLGNCSAGMYCFGNNSGGCSENGIRLVSSTNSGNAYGRVEVCLNGLWGTVCDDGWDSNDATTVCRQLGYNNTNIGIPTRRAKIFPPGSGPIHLSRAQCGNDDTILTECDIDKTGVNNCKHSEDAGVICMGPSYCTDGEVRLVGGENDRQGHVEICFSGVWGTVCANGWDEVDANVVCSQLGYGQQAIHTINLTAPERLVLLSKVSCNKSHSQLSQCVHPESIGLNNCDRSSLAGVICSGNGSNLSTINPIMTYTSTVLKTNTESSTDLISTAPSNFQQSAILGAVGGALALFIILTAAVIVLVVLVLRRRQRQKYKGSMDNPTYDVNISVSPLAIGNEDKPEIRNPIYCDISPTQTGSYLPTNGMNAGIYSECKLVDETVYENNDRSVVGDDSNRGGEINDGLKEELVVEAAYDVPDRGGEINGGLKEELVVEAAYDVPDRGGEINGGLKEELVVDAAYDVPDMVSGVDNENCYSALGQTDYATLEANVSKSTQKEQHPPGDNEYSQLQH